MESLTTSARNGGCLFAADPQKTFDGQTIFWAPEALSTVLPVRRVVVSLFSKGHHLELAKIAGGQLRRAPDGWHAVVPLGGAIHRLWLHELPVGDSLLTVELPLDANFDIRAQAAHRFWLALEERPLGSPPLALPVQRRRRLTLAVRALDGWLEGNSYREIAEGLFGRRRVPDRGWKAHDLRGRTVRLVQTGLALVRGGYRALLGRGDRKR
jgi:hypothetical protein